MSSWDVVAYTYQADIHCPDCIADKAGDAIYQLDPERVYYFTRDALELWARLADIDYLNESTYDSDDYPKVIFADGVEDIEHCGSCHEVIR